MMVQRSMLLLVLLATVSSCTAQPAEKAAAPAAPDATQPIAAVPPAQAAPVMPPTPVAPASQLGTVPRVAGIDFGGLRFEKTRESLGTIDEGVVVSAKFPFVNKSDRTIKINNMQATCGCTTGKLDKMEFAPGEGDTITLNFNSTGKPGHQERILRVLTDDPEASDIPLTIVVEVRQSIYLKPASLQFGDVYEGDAKSVSAELINISEMPIKITRTAVTGSLADTPSAPLVNVTDPEPYTDPATGTKGTRSIVTVTLPRESQRGMINGNVILTTDQPKRPTINLFFQGRVRGAVDVEPATIYFGIMAPNQTTERVATLSVPPGQTFTLVDYKLEPDTTIVSADKPTPKMTVTCESPHMSGFQLIRSSIESGGYDGHFQGKLILTGKLGERDQSLSIPVNFFVRPMPKPPEGVAPGSASLSAPTAPTP